jgi:hypothetical protein
VGTGRPTPPAIAWSWCACAHPPTLDYVRRRTAAGKSKREIIRRLKRFVARAIFGYLCRVSKPTRPEQISA